MAVADTASSVGVIGVVVDAPVANAASSVVTVAIVGALPGGLSSDKLRGAESWMHEYAK